MVTRGRPAGDTLQQLVATKAQFLVRFDDICSTMNWRMWDRIEAELDAHGIKPVLAVVPANADPQLAISEPNPAFWDRIRTWERKGWSIAMHGFEHRYVTKASGILRLNARSEFAGLPHGEQESKLRRSLDLFRAEGVEPRCWIAPSHSFDWTTVRILNQLGIRVISDGLSRLPYEDRHGSLWVPQQLWRFKLVPPGIWTVCCHHNGWSDQDLLRFCQSLDDFGSQITTLPEVCRSYQNRRKTTLDRLSEVHMLLSIHAKSLIPAPYHRASRRTLA
jgi:peptidoglycan/xylan/chitin deacetylase (PgdA/CDA1 family)